ncbi:hypothetical protein BDU57DRAFT_276143 [Ampelomyces quisqualis]|uniref:Uncharacterized protein n=1 Tax=Ampelomyces quisqualis TaxID=50730 RepID=A0A6A5QKX8_AMPQU|nr:hypothetical protein BDU57DRAFT_276143 [Ampelomyces quisqualis]
MQSSSCKISSEKQPWQTLSRVATEPSIFELLDEKRGKKRNFSSGLMIAPYRGWRPKNFAKLHGHKTATLDAEREHVLLLHEDPGYMADTLRDLGRLTYQKHVAEAVVVKSYVMLARWEELERRFSEFDKIFQDDTRIHDQIHAI